MSSLRNAVKRITHKERSQPQSRKHFGILEKHKDYKQRARDYHSKQDRIKAMRQKASMKNPDEFYFGMHRSKVVDGRHTKTQQARQMQLEDQIGPEAVRIMKDQDLTYVRMQKQRDARKVERLQASLHFLDDRSAKNKRKHTVFVESKEEADKFDVAQHFGTLPELAGRAYNRPRVETLRQTALAAGVASVHRTGGEDDEAYAVTEKELQKEAKMAKRTAKKIAKARSSAYREMEERSKRVAVMERAEAHLVTEKLVAGKGRKRKIRAAENGQPAVYKWRRKRQS